MTGVLAALGPHGSSTAWIGPVGLTHCHLGHLTPEDRLEKQPVIFAGGKCGLVFDGRLDNRPELASALGWSNARLGAMSDSQLFAASWERFGAQFLPRVVGPYAVIVWNGTELVAARDPLGQNVLYHHDAADRIIVGSTPAAIHSTGVPCRLDESKLLDSLLLNYSDSSRSYFAGVQRLQMGCTFTASQARVSTAPFYDILDATPVELATDGEYVEAAKEVLGRATKAVLRTASAPSLMLSSGLDSTLVAMAVLPPLRDRGERLHAYTSVPLPQWVPAVDEVRPGDESVGVNAFLGQNPDVAHSYIDAANLGPFHQLDALMAHGGVPPRNVSNLHWIHEVHRLTNERDGQVVLNGGFGNISIGHSGSTLVLELLTQRRVRQAWRELSATAGSPRRLPRTIARDVLRPLAPSAIVELVHRTRGAAVDFTSYTAANPDSALVQEAVGRADPRWGLAPRNRHENLYRVLNDAHQDAADVRQALRAMYRTEARDPTLDLRVVEFSFGVPTEQFRRDGTMRWLQRRMMSSAPQPILNGRRGRQAADSRIRLAGELDTMRADLERFRSNPFLAEVLDLDRLVQLLGQDAFWSARRDLPGTQGNQASLQLLGLSRAIATGRFVEQAQKRQLPVREVGS